tara:strand:- start:397 stop:693 length:297 start_codon:yes stop_codon:yes gene_type:complete
MAWVFGDLGDLVNSYVPNLWKTFTIEMFRKYKNVIEIERGFVRIINGKFYIRETETIKKYYPVIRLQNEVEIIPVTKFKIKRIDECGSYRYERTSNYG